MLGEGASVQSRFACAAVAVAPAEGTIQLSASLASSLLLLAHHPTVAGASAAATVGASPAWTAVSARLGRSVAEVLATAPADVAAALVADPARGAAALEVAQQQAARGALRAAMGLAAPALFDALLRALGPLLDTSAHDALTPRETKIYFTPAGASIGELGSASCCPV